MRRFELWWADLPEPALSGPGYRRPVLIVQADSFNRSKIGTVIVAALTSNTNLASAPGNVIVPRKYSGLSRESVVNVSQLLTLDKSLLIEPIGYLPPSLATGVEAGLKLVLELG